MGFDQFRFYCFKKKVGRVFHIKTALNDLGEAAVHAHTLTEIENEDFPKACGSFEYFDDDNSSLSRNCSKWGRVSSDPEFEVNRWGTKQATAANRMYNLVAQINFDHAVQMISRKPTYEYSCDDPPLNTVTNLVAKPLSVGDVWMVYVRWYLEPAEKALKLISDKTLWHSWVQSIRFLLVAIPMNLHWFCHMVCTRICHQYRLRDDDGNVKPGKNVSLYFWCLSTFAYSWLPQFFPFRRSSIALIVSYQRRETVKISQNDTQNSLKITRCKSHGRARRHRGHYMSSPVLMLNPFTPKTDQFQISPAA